MVLRTTMQKFDHFPSVMMSLYVNKSISCCMAAVSIWRAQLQETRKVRHDIRISRALKISHTMLQYCEFRDMKTQSRSFP